MQIRPILGADRPEWLRMRRALWPGPDDHPGEVAAFFDAGRGPAVVFVADREAGGALAGFIELSLRSYAEGCHASPVLSMEGVALRRVLLPREASRMSEAKFRSFLRDSLVWIHKGQSSSIESLARQIPIPEVEPALTSMRSSSNGAVIILDSGAGRYWLGRGDRFEEIVPPPGFGLADVLGDRSSLRRLRSGGHLSFN